MPKEIENPMVNDDLWAEIDKLKRETADEEFYRQADEEYDEEQAENISWFAWSRANDGYAL